MKNRSMRWALALIAMAPMAIARAEEPKNDLARIQGKWTGKFGPGDGTPITVTFKDNTVTVDAKTPDGDAIQVKGEFRLDESAKPHKALDWLKFTTESGDNLPDRQGIYLFEDADTLKTATSAVEGDRPGSFNGGEAGTLTIVFKREKPADAPKNDEAAAGKAADKDATAPWQGEWTTMLGPEKNIPLEITIKGNNVSVRIKAPDGSTPTLEGEFKVDEKATPHKKVDWINFKSEGGDPIPDNLGIYEFSDANTVRVCNGGPDKSRPSEIKDGGPGGPTILTLKRTPPSK